MKDHLFLEGPGHDHVDLVAPYGAQNTFCRIPLFIMNGRLRGQRQLAENFLELRRGLFARVPHVDQTQIGGKTIPNPLRLRQYLEKTRRERARDSDRG